MHLCRVVYRTSRSETYLVCDIAFDHRFVKRLLKYRLMVEIREWVWPT